MEGIVAVCLVANHILLGKPLTMKVLLLAPYSSYWKSQFIFCEPMGLSYIGSFAQSAGHEVRLIQQLTPSRPSNGAILETVRSFAPDVIGISVLSDSYSISKELVRQIRTVSKALIVFGGKHASINPDIVNDPEVDVAVVGEGEETFNEILDRYDGTLDSVKDIAGISYLDGEVQCTEPRQRIQELDRLPFPMREGLPMDRYRMVNIFAIPASRQKMVSCVSSRGCVYNCLFCPTPRLSGRKWYSRSVGNIIEEIDQLDRQYRPNYLLFHDEDVLLSRKRSIELCNTMISFFLYLPALSNQQDCLRRFLWLKD